MNAFADGDRIEIVNLVLLGRHGVLAEEATLGQRFTLDIVVGLDLRAAGRNDQVAQTVDYAALTATVAEAFAQRRKLIEAAAETVAAAVLARHPRVRWVRVTVRKPAAPVAAVFDHMAVTITRARDGGGDV